MEDLRKKGGTGALAAKKVDDFINGIANGSNNDIRKKFSYTWNGEYRIKNCRKIDLVGAYRLVLIHKDNHFVFLYVGSHDDCFRWIERNKGRIYGIYHSDNVIKITSEAAKRDVLPPDVLEERRYAEEYEEKFMRRLDENTLLKIFSGWCKESEGWTNAKKR